MVRCSTQESSPLVGTEKQAQSSGFCTIEESVCAATNKQNATTKEEEEEYSEHRPSKLVSWARIDALNIAMLFAPCSGIAASPFYFFTPVTLASVLLFVSFPVSSDPLFGAIFLFNWQRFSDDR